MLQYTSAFDDEVAEFEDGAEVSEVPEVPQEAEEELPGFPESILENVLEEPPEDMMDEAPEPQPEEEIPAKQADSGRPSTSVVHGPYYYFYQGGWYPQYSANIMDNFWLFTMRKMFPFLGH